MKTDPTVAQVSVEQRDWEAARELAKPYPNNHCAECQCGQCMCAESYIDGLAYGLALARHRLAATQPPAREEVRREIINTPETADFMSAVPLEAAHQRDRWGHEHDAGKAPEDWLFLVGYLAGKACAAARVGNHDKALHHTISSAAALANWHAALTGGHTAMRPGIAPPDTGGTTDAA